MKQLKCRKHGKTSPQCEVCMRIEEMRDEFVVVPM